MSVLNRIALSANELEAKVARAIVQKVEHSKYFGSVKNFTDQLNITINRCYDSVATVTKEQLKMVQLEKEFRKQRNERELNLFKQWEELAGPSWAEKSESIVVFQHVLQHVWSYSVLRGSSETSRSASSKQEHNERRVDSVEMEAVSHHAGWAIKRARDTIVASGGPLTIKTVL